MKENTKSIFSFNLTSENNCLLPIMTSKSFIKIRFQKSTTWFLWQSDY